jgi:hypothetical protein
VPGSDNPECTLALRHPFCLDKKIASSHLPVINELPWSEFHFSINQPILPFRDGKRR